MDRQTYVPRHARPEPAALVTDTLRALLGGLTRWVVPSGYLGERPNAFAPAATAEAVRVDSLTSVLRPWLELEDELQKDVEWSGVAYTMTTRSGTRRVEPWRVMVATGDRPDVRPGEHIHATLPAQAAARLRSLGERRGL